MKRILLILGAIVTLVTTCFSTGAQADALRFATADIVGNQFVVNVRYNECLALVGGGAANGTPIGHYPCEAAPAPWNRWSFEAQGNRYICDYENILGNCTDYRQVFLYRLHSEQTGKCFEPKDGGTSSGTILQEWDCRTGTLRQSWFVGTGPNGSVYFFNAKAYDEGQHLRAIDAPPFAQDYRVRLWTFNKSDAQQWVLR
ncbi:hypothetical protein GCM10022419_135640 [Nonomuraea rosea]|uniref:Ricin B lectin domain-containing protein n=1 Tax=Nonomuraea rosea TaxID=638574 RepID=A0ABP7A8X4_9ACTN